MLQTDQVQQQKFGKSENWQDQQPGLKRNVAVDVVIAVAADVVIF